MAAAADDHDVEVEIAVTRAGWHRLSDPVRFEHIAGGAVAWKCNRQRPGGVRARQDRTSSALGVLVVKR
jgi:hypothetical protein